MAEKQVELVLRPRRGWRAIDLAEMWHYRDLLFFLVGRDIKIRYRQTVLGILWAVLQPLAGMVIFTIFFNKMAGIESGGEAPIRSSPTRGSWRGRSSRTQS